MLNKRIDGLKSRITDYALYVELMIDTAHKALVEKDSAMLKNLEGNMENNANENERSIENECVAVTAQFQPVAVDLRTIFTILKMNNDLERIGDHAVNIAQRSELLLKVDGFKMSDDLTEMFAKSTEMLEKAVESFVKSDAELAKSVLVFDEHVDNIRDRIVRRTIANLSKSPADVEQHLAVVDIARNLERIADLSTNIAEDAIFMVIGANVKHNYC